ncbi:spore maturation protein CgeB [Rathayibacter sp. PhB152]|uniref:glycosyltransferase family protein n=1 Tax=Rathayibacter sp. PhB152 TaxID=2485190 RepID=UPI000F4BF530|nr:glycosyltransferase [Rathayibacter sp. PhB152]ROQ65162.1 spore maturation protein CgeB [Rathayibacter sp. PhB152]
MSRPVLVVSPVFHDYWRAIEAALVELGEDVVVHRYDDTAGVVRLRDAVAHRFPRSRLRRWSRRSETERAIRALRETSPRAVLVVKGDSLGDEWWAALAGGGAPVVLWLYDELVNMTFDLERLRALASARVSIASYSPRDVATLRAAGIEATHVPDAFDSLLAWTPRPSAAVTFIGARYPERERVLRELAAGGVDIEVFGRQWSRHPGDVVRTGRLRGAGLRAHGDVSRAAYYGAMAGSIATLAIHGTGHGGLSMRAFEAPGVGALALLDRPDIADHYEVDREVLVFDGREQLVEHVRHAQADPVWAHRVRDAAAARTRAEHTFVHRMRAVRALWG